MPAVTSGEHVRPSIRGDSARGWDAGQRETRRRAGAGLGGVDGEMAINGHEASGFKMAFKGEGS
jgi:hypothetical protein